MADGVAPEKLYPLDLDRVFRSLDKIKPSIVKFWDTGAEPVQMLIDGNVAPPGTVASPSGRSRVHRSRSTGTRASCSGTRWSCRGAPRMLRTR